MKKGRGLFPGLFQIVQPTVYLVDFVAVNGEIFFGLVHTINQFIVRLLLLFELLNAVYNKSLCLAVTCISADQRAKKRQ